MSELKSKLLQTVTDIVADFDGKCDISEEDTIAIAKQIVAANAPVRALHLECVDLLRLADVVEKEPKTKRPSLESMFAIFSKDAVPIIASYFLNNALLTGAALAFRFDDFEWMKSLVPHLKLVPKLGGESCVEDLIGGVIMNKCWEGVNANVIRLLSSATTCGSVPFLKADGWVLKYADMKGQDLLNTHVLTQLLCREELDMGWVIGKSQFAADQFASGTTVDGDIHYSAHGCFWYQVEHNKKPDCEACEIARQCKMKEAAKDAAVEAKRRAAYRAVKWTHSSSSSSLRAFWLAEGSPSLFRNSIKVCSSSTPDSKHNMADEKKPKPELYDEDFGPYADAAAAIKQRDELLQHKGFPMVSKSTVAKKDDGFYLTVTFRSRFPASLPPPAVEEPLLDFIPGYDGDSKDEKN